MEWSDTLSSTTQFNLLPSTVASSSSHLLKSFARWLLSMSPVRALHPSGPHFRSCTCPSRPCVRTRPRREQPVWIRSNPLGSYHVHCAVWRVYLCVNFAMLPAYSTHNGPLVAHTVQSFYFRMRWLLPTASLAGIMEVIGWSARLWSSINPANHDPFIMQ